MVFRVRTVLAVPIALACGCLGAVAGDVGKLVLIGDVKAFNVLAKGGPTSLLHPTAQKVALSDVRDEDFLGDSGSDDGEVQTTMQQLRPIFATMPLNSFGRLDMGGLRYLLHRHFAHSYGWLMRGLAPDGGKENTVFPFQLIDEPRVQVGLKALLSAKGMSLQGAARLAHLLKKQVQRDAVERLSLAWKVNGYKLDDVVSIQAMDGILETQIAGYIMYDMWKNVEQGQVTTGSVTDLRHEILDSFPSWPRTQMYLREALEDIADEADLNFGSAERVVFRVLDHFGRWQDKECDQLKYKLLRLENPLRQGHVDLVRFYGEAVKTGEMFSESMAYLRQLGALDESDAVHPSVLIPNYVSSSANHLGKSQYFELACIDECQEFLGQIERRVGAPEATADQIEDIILRLSPPSHPEREQSIPGDVLDKLGLIADVHGGRVPLHGHSFAAWLHLMYPRDCPYPHEAGRTMQEELFHFEDRTGWVGQETNESMIKIIASLEVAARVARAMQEQTGEGHVSQPPASRLRVREHEVRLPVVLFAAASGALIVLSVFVGWFARRSLGFVVGARGPLLDVDGGAGGSQPGPSEQGPAIDSATHALGTAC